MGTPRASQVGAVRTTLPAPHLPPSALERPRLVERLAGKTAGRLTCLTAPAGYGKTVLLAQWHATEDRRVVAWVALDSRDADPQHFTGHLLHALGTSWGEVPDEMLERLGTHVEFGARLLEAVTGGVSQRPETVIVLDDVQTLPASSLAEFGAFVAHAADQLHFVLSSRYELLSVASAVARTAEVATIFAEDLAFDREDIRRLDERLGVALDAHELDELHARTEGWPLGVVYALHLAEEPRGRDAAVGYLESFDRFVFHYLKHEVLDELPERLRSFVLCTSAPDGFSVQLANALTGQNDSASLVDELIGKGVRLNARRDNPTRFAYPPLLAASFRAESRTSSPGREEAMLCKAAEWHLVRGETTQCVDYLLRAQAFERVIEVMTESTCDLYRAGLAPAAVAWMRSIPEPIRREHPAATLFLAGMCQETGEAVAADVLLGELEDDRLTGTELSHWADAIRCLGIEHHSAASDVLERAQRLLDSSNEASSPKPAGRDSPMRHDQPSRFPHLISAIAHVSGGRALAGLDRHEEAWRWFMAGLADPTTPPSFQVQLLGAFARSEATIGRLRAADHHARQALALAAEIGYVSDVDCAEAYLALAIAALERASLEEATVFLNEAESRARSNRRSNLLAAIVAQRARAALLADRAAEGLTTLQGFRAAGDPDPPPAVAARLVAIEAELLLTTGQAARAAHVLAEAPLVTVDVAAARARLAVDAHDEDGLAHVLDPWQKADECMRPRSAASRLLWQAAAAQLRGEIEPACMYLEGALRQADTEGLRQVFLDAGGKVHSWLSRLPASSSSPALVSMGRPTSSAQAARVPDALYPHVDTLSARELTVLRALSAGAANDEIAAQLFISMNTLKTHLKHIYRKLGVNTRLQAVLRGEHLGLSAEVTGDDGGLGR
ncbi:MAG: LuxR C-terminal-related transcriptional regulator [Actinomycetes bacterium]